MATQAETLTSQEVLYEADRAFDSGDLRKGSRLMWKAAVAGIAAVADIYGWPCDSMDEIKETMFRLNEIDNAKGSDGVIRYYRHRVHGKFVEAGIFRDHAETEIWDQPEFRWSDTEFEAHRRSQKNFIKLLAEMGRVAEDLRARELCPYSFSRALKNNTGGLQCIG